MLKNSFECTHPPPRRCAGSAVDTMSDSFSPPLVGMIVGGGLLIVGVVAALALSARKQLLFMKILSQYVDAGISMQQRRSHTRSRTSTPAASQVNSPSVTKPASSSSLLQLKRDTKSATNLRLPLKGIKTKRSHSIELTESHSVARSGDHDDEKHPV